MEEKMVYRIFTSDIGPMQFSALKDVDTADPFKTIEDVAARFSTVALALPHTRRDLWPDGQTGKLSEDCIKFIAARGLWTGRPE